MFCDVIGFPRAVTDRARTLVAERTGIAVENVLIATAGAIISYGVGVLYDAYA